MIREITVIGNRCCRGKSPFPGRFFFLTLLRIEGLLQRKPGCWETLLLSALSQVRESHLSEKPEVREAWLGSVLFSACLPPPFTSCRPFYRDPDLLRQLAMHGIGLSWKQYPLCLLVFSVSLFLPLFLKPVAMEKHIIYPNFESCFCFVRSFVTVELEFSSP